MRLDYSMNYEKGLLSQHTCSEHIKKRRMHFYEFEYPSFSVWNIFETKIDLSLYWQTTGDLLVHI